MQATRLSSLLLVTVLVSALAACRGPTDDTPTDNASAAEKALDGLQERYDALTEGDLDDPMQWASEDLKKIGDWEYKVVEHDGVVAAELEAVLNKAGTERWEVIWIEKTLSGHLIVMKRSSISYLSKIPLSQLGRLVIPDSEGQE